MSAHPRVIHKRRENITALPLYYCGNLLKKSTKEKEFKKYYGELRGATLFLYKDDTQDRYTEKLELEQVKSMELESPYERKTTTIFTLTLNTEEVQLKTENADKGEEWRGYILTVVKKEIPSKLKLLPGQMVQLRETLAQERKRNAHENKPLPPLPPLPPRPLFLSSSPPSSKVDMPVCFFSVTREEAVQMLKENPENGSIIIRPSTLANNYSVTIRQQMPSGPVIKNYRVTSTNSGFVIELEDAVTVSSLNDVLQYFLQETEYRLQPYVTSQPYDTRIEPQPAPMHVSINSPKPKIVPKAQVAPIVRSENKKELPPTPPKQQEDEYVVPDDDKPDEHKPEHNIKTAQLDGELRRILKFRRKNLYTAGD